MPYPYLGRLAAFRQVRRGAFCGVFLVLCGQALAGEAVCSDFTAATGEDLSLFNGYVYGYVSAKMEGKGPNAINAATLVVRNMVEAYCKKKPNDRVQAAVAVFAGTVAKFGLDPLH